MLGGTLEHSTLKKTVSFILIIVLAMNTLGYYGIFLGMEYQHNQSMTSQLDGDSYDPAKAITIQIPLTVPYMYDDADFKRAEGLFQHEGEFYRLVKQKYSKDTLMIVCVRDFKEKQINETMAEYAMTFGSDSEEPGQSSTLTVSFIKDYITEVISIHSIAAGWHRDVFAAQHDAKLLSTLRVPALQPPDLRG